MARRLPIPARAWEKLQPFIHHKRARQRVILYLIAAGYTVPELRKISVAELRALTFHSEIAVSRDEAVDGMRATDNAFSVHGRTLPHTAFYRFIRLAAMSAVNRPMSQEHLREYLNSRE